ncbi:DUF433 domain-containing protein [Parasediminibacterium sp. JCM 36343]|uniref:DUF433 domain-containing protein n=1 Tax=Parasediminibacterium sp. JCM 36343 TaxID=3374279 RepID=UPI00397DF56E
MIKFYVTTQVQVCLICHEGTKARRHKVLREEVEKKKEEKLYYQCLLNFFFLRVFMPSWLKSIFDVVSSNNFIISSNYANNMNWQEYSVSDNQVLLGKPAIKGTRISVELILELLSLGWTEQQIFESYPTITKDSLKVVLGYL